MGLVRATVLLLLICSSITAFSLVQCLYCYLRFEYNRIFIPDSQAHGLPSAQVTYSESKPIDLSLSAVKNMAQAS